MVLNTNEVIRSAHIVPDTFFKQVLSRRLGIMFIQVERKIRRFYCHFVTIFVSTYLRNLCWTSFTKFNNDTPE